MSPLPISKINHFSTGISSELRWLHLTVKLTLQSEAHQGCHQRFRNIRFRLPPIAFSQLFVTTNSYVWCFYEAGINSIDSYEVTSLKLILTLGKETSNTILQLSSVCKQEVHLEKIPISEDYWTLSHQQTVSTDQILFSFVFFILGFSFGIVSTINGYDGSVGISEVFYVVKQWLVVNTFRTLLRDKFQNILNPNRT